MDGSQESAGLLREFLANADVPCPGCGYNLRGLRAEACPECNQALVLRVGLAEPRMRLFVAGLVGLAAGAGFSGLLTVYFVFTLAAGGAPAGNEFGVITAAGLLVEGALLAAWLWRGAALRRTGMAARIALVAAAWTLTVANLAVFSWVIR